MPSRISSKWVRGGLSIARLRPVAVLRAYPRAISAHPGGEGINPKRALSPFAHWTRIHSFPLIRCDLVGCGGEGRLRVAFLLPSWIRSSISTDSALLSH